ncbi:MAG: hypothetical protein ABII23_00315 [bacterium]
MLRKLSALLVFVALVSGLYILASYFAGKALKDLINTKISSYFRSHITAADVKVNPACAIIDINDIHISHTINTAAEVSIDSIRIDFEWIPMFFRKLIIEDFIINKPQFIIFKNKDRKYLIIPRIPFIPYSLNMQKKWNKKYPPATIENTRINDAHITYVDGAESLIFEPVNIIVSKFWRSPDRKRTNLDFSMQGSLKGSKGAGKLSGQYYSENDAKSFSGDLVIDNLDLSYIYPVLREKLPFKIHSGFITVNAKPLCSENRINTILHIELTQFNIMPLQKKQKLGGIPFDMLTEFLKSTGGMLRADLHIMGTLEEPEFNINELLTQIIAQKMQEDIQFKINKKASKAAGKISDILKKSQQSDK